ncbi:MAG: archease [bacterium]|nr:archease [bacterium]
MKYKLLDDLTSDVMFEAYGKTFEELLENSAMAMFSVICRVEKVKPTTTIKIELVSDSKEKLLYDWLSALLTQSEIHKLFLSRFKINKISELHLFAEASGEKISPGKGETLVKGIPYYGFKIHETDKGFSARVTLDI